MDVRRENRPPDKGIDLVAMFVNQNPAGRVLQAGQKCFEGREGVVGLVDEIGPLNLPEGGGVVVVVVTELIAVFKNAADFDAGQSKHHAADLLVCLL